MKSKIKNFLITLLAFGFLAMFNWICFDGAEKSAKIFNTQDTCVEIEATITSSEKYTEIDEGFEDDYWHANVSYKYKGVSYSGVFYDSMEKPPKIGKKVNVKIDPKNPGELLPDNTEFTLSLILSPIFLSFITFGLFLAIKGFAETVLKKFERESEFRATYIAALFIACKLLIESYSFYNKHNSIVYAVFSIIAVIVSFILYRCLHKKAETDPQ